MTPPKWFTSRLEQTYDHGRREIIRKVQEKWKMDGMLESAVLDAPMAEYLEGVKKPTMFYLNKEDRQMADLEAIALHPLKKHIIFLVKYGDLKPIVKLVKERMPDYKMPSGEEQAAIEVLVCSTIFPKKIE